MKISKDFADAIMMISCIILVLIGTTTFEESSLKVILMSVLGLLAVSMGIIRLLGKKKLH